MRRYNVALYLSAFFLMFGVGMIVAILPQRMIQLSGTPSHAGYLASAFALTFVLIQIPIGRIADRWGVKHFLTAGYFICAVSGGIYYFSSNELSILLGRMLQGIGEVPIWSLGPALLSLQYPRHKGRVMGIYNAAVHCGLTAGSLTGIWTQGVFQGNRAFLVFAFTGVLGGLMTALFVKGPAENTVRSGTQEEGTSLSFLPVHPRNRFVFPCILLYGAGYGIFITMIPGFLISTRNCGHQAVSLLFVLFYTGISLSQVVAGPISDTLGRKPVMIAGLGTAALGMALFTLGPLSWILSLLTLSALGLGSFCVSALAWLNQGVSDAMKGTISGCFYLFWGIGYFSGPILMGFCGEPDRWQNGFFLLGGLLAAGMIACAELPEPAVANDSLNV